MAGTQPRCTPEDLRRHDSFRAPGPAALALDLCFSGTGSLLPARRPDAVGDRSLLTSYDFGVGHACRLRARFVTHPGTGEGLSVVTLLGPPTAFPMPYAEAGRWRLDRRCGGLPSAIRRPSVSLRRAASGSPWMSRG